MSAVVLQVGQCGNQLGLEWCKLLNKKSNRYKKRCPFSSRTGELAAVCVDSEPKVLRRMHEFVKKNKMHPSNIIDGKGGLGSNWAYGYHGGQGEVENSLLQRTMEAVRREAERRDYYGGTVLLHSLSGGTGSGLGSRLCEEIRDEFAVGHILTVSVVPHHSGESPLQHYNTLLSLASLHRSADGMLLFNNDHVLSCTGSQHSSAAGRGAVSCGLPQGTLSAMNAHIISCTAGLLLPVQSLSTDSGQSLGIEPWELIRSVCPIPTAKLLHTTQVSASETSHWDSLVSGVLQNLPHLSPAGKPYSSRAVLAVARGNQDNSFIASNVLQKLRQGHRCVKWNPFPVDHWTDPRNETGISLFSRLLTVCSNHSSVTKLLHHVVQRSRDMLAARAYLHWYERYGVETDDFHQALSSLSALIEEYDSQ
ncbi:tubulin delta chain-like [Trichomycterus rosablanca]|uniref:tubulin delta chain-like n=1 Tax=Trichomycterus rosablanca TaxID=2290929 RepID=UPI002F35A322